LSSASLVTRGDDTRYALRPVDARLADQALEECCLIQIAVVDAIVDKGIGKRDPAVAGLRGRLPGRGKGGAGAP
jgi:hypothetical protein